MRTLMLPILALLAPLALAQKAPSFGDARAFTAEQAVVARQLFLEIGREPGNVVFSPWSLVRALAMAHEGAAGETAAELERVLRLPPGGAGETFAWLAARLQPVRSDEAVRLEFAASLWGQRGARLDNDFLSRLKRGYASEFFRVDFADTATTRASINAWASEHTHGRVPELLRQGQPAAQTRLVLVDTAFFKANWREPFPASATRPEKFHTAEGRDVEAATMHDVRYVNYGESELAQVIELPYEGGMTLTIVLPKERAADALARTLEHEGFAEWSGVLASREVVLVLPKFRFEFACDAARVLARMGVELALDLARADFSRVGAERLAIGAVRHVAFVELDEKGTEAAAATGLLLCGASMKPEPPPPPLEVRVDRPFLFAIRHASTGAVLFVGRVDDPTRG